MLQSPQKSSISDQVEVFEVCGTDGYALIVREWLNAHTFQTEMDRKTSLKILYTRTNQDSLMNWKKQFKTDLLTLN